MLLREKGSKDVVSYGWDEAQAALRTGNYEVVSDNEAAAAVAALDGSPDDLEDKTKAELEAVAAHRGVDISGARTKAEILAALRG